MQMLLAAGHVDIEQAPFIHFRSTEASLSNDGLGRDKMPDIAAPPGTCREVIFNKLWDKHGEPLKTFRAMDRKNLYRIERNKLLFGSRGLPIGILRPMLKKTSEGFIFLHRARMKVDRLDHPLQRDSPAQGARISFAGRVHLSSWKSMTMFGQSEVQHNLKQGVSLWVA
jgi:hypothetical protein